MTKTDVDKLKAENWLSYDLGILREKYKFVLDLLEMETQANHTHLYSVSHLMDSNAKLVLENRKLKEN